MIRKNIILPHPSAKSKSLTSLSAQSVCPSSFFSPATKIPLSFAQSHNLHQKKLFSIISIPPEGEKITPSSDNGLIKRSPLQSKGKYQSYHKLPRDQLLLRSFSYNRKDFGLPLFGNSHHRFTNRTNLGPQILPSPVAVPMKVQKRSIFIYSEETPNPNSLKFFPSGEKVLDGACKKKKKRKNDSIPN